MFFQSLLGPDGFFSLHNYRQLLAESRQRMLLSNSLLLGGGSAALAVFIGMPLGILLARAGMPAKRFIRLLLLIPVVLPPYILALAWIYIAGSYGLVATVLGFDLLSKWTYGIAATIFVMGLSFFPIVMLATEGAARRVDAHLEEAAMLVGTPKRVFRGITAPLMAPSVAAAALLVFILALAEFGVPGLLRVPVFTTEIFTSFASLYDFGRATALALPLLAAALSAGLVVQLLTGERTLATSRSLHIGLPLNLGKWRLPAAAMVGVAMLLSVALPLTALVYESAAAWSSGISPGESRQAIINSLLVSAVAATLIVSIGTVLGYGVSRSRTRTRRIAELVSLTAFAVPGTVIAIGLIGLWNRPGVFGKIYTSMAIIVIAHAARFLPVAILILCAGALRIPPSCAEAAEVFGAGWLRIFCRIVVPQLREAIAAAWIIVFIFSFGELGATILVSPPGESTLPVRIYTLLANTTSSEVAVLTLMQAGVVLIPMILLAVILGKKRGAT
jgi:iron(III) transport system permease protein